MTRDYEHNFETGALFKTYFDFFVQNIRNTQSGHFTPITVIVNPI